MGEWVIGAVINLFGSVAINFGTNLLKLGHDEREKLSVLGNEGTDVKATMKPIIYFQTWRVGIVFFAIGNCLNFISFGYAAQFTRRSSWLRSTATLHFFFTVSLWS